jgi:diguanylate cyclase (GGDEF)-like protein
MRAQLQRVDLKRFLESEVPLECLGTGLRTQVEQALAQGGELFSLSMRVVSELRALGVLRPVGRLREGTRNVVLYAVEGSARAYDLRPLLRAEEAVAGQPSATASEHPPSEGTSREEPPAVPAPRPPESSVGAVTLAAIRGTYQRDWISFGLDASLENLLHALRTSLHDPGLRLLLWAERLPRQLGQGRSWQLASREDSLSLTLERAQAGAPVTGGIVAQGSRWYPLWLEDQLVGALGADLRVEPGLVEEAAGAVRDLIAAVGRSQRRVFNDPLTGVHNRGYFDRQFSVEMERSRRSGVPLALLFADLDHFKAINDEFGHEIGDMVLRSVASLLVAQLRRIDYVFRYGGEEFTILLPGTDLDEAARTAKRLCHAVQANELGLEDGVRLRVSLSIGVALFPEHAEDERVLLRRADLAMYQAKQEGRNRVCTWGSNRP